jgi:Tfp pilus assembly protein PilO
MNELKSLFSKIPVWFWFVLFAGYLGYNYYNFTHGPESPLIAKKNEVESINQETEKIKKRLAEVDSFVKALESKKEEIRAIAKKLDESQTTLSDSFDVPSFMQTAVGEARKIGLKISSIRPTGSDKKEYFGEQSFGLNFQGTYSQVLLYFSRMTQLQSIIRVDNFSLRPTSQKPGMMVQLEGTVTLRGFYYVRSKADEILSQAGKGP